MRNYAELQGGRPGVSKKWFAWLPEPCSLLRHYLSVFLNRALSSVLKPPAPVLSVPFNTFINVISFTGICSLAAFRVQILLASKAQGCFELALISLSPRKPENLLLDSKGYCKALQLQCVRPEVEEGSLWITTWKIGISSDSVSFHYGNWDDHARWRISVWPSSSLAPSWGFFFHDVFFNVESCGCKKNLGLSCGEWFGNKQKNARIRFISHSSSKFLIGRVNVSVPCYHSGYAYTTCGTPEYFAPEMAGVPRNP